MLILTRRKGEAIIIDDDVKVLVLDSHRNQVRIGIEAPKNVVVNREEIHHKIHTSPKNENDSAELQLTPKIDSESDQ